MKVIYHNCTWWWGETVKIFLSSGEGTIEVQIEKATPNTAYFIGLSVLPESRRHQLGTQLIAYATKVAIDKGLKFLQLTADKTNEWLVNWYKRLGFEIWSEEEHEYVMIALSSDVKNSLVGSFQVSNV